MKLRLQTRSVIWHHSLSADASVEIVRSWHEARGFEDIGYHFLIHSDGTTDAGRDLRFVGAHAIRRNGASIGVCLMGDFGKLPPTSKQIGAAQRLYHELCRHYGYALGIEFHRVWPNPCPGPLLDRKAFRAALEAVTP